jgi:hypothetical protein
VVDEQNCSAREAGYRCKDGEETTHVLIAFEIETVEISGEWIDHDQCGLEVDDMLVQKIGEYAVTAILKHMNVCALSACRLKARFDGAGSAILRAQEERSARLLLGS